MITVRYFAGARAAAGLTEEPVPRPTTVADLVDTLTARHGEQLGSVLLVASFLVDGATCRDRHRPVPDRAVVDVLPPFAGG